MLKNYLNSVVKGLKYYIETNNIIKINLVNICGIQHTRFNIIYIVKLYLLSYIPIL